VPPQYAAAPETGAILRKARFPRPPARATVRAAMRFKSEIKFAVLAVLALAAYTLLAWQLGWHDQDFTHAQHGKKIGGIAFAGGIWLAVRERRDRRQGGFIEFGEGFQTGIVVSAAAAFLNGAFTAFYSHVLNPGWLQRAWEWEKAGLVALGKTERELGRPEAIATASQKLVFQLLFDPLGQLIMGLILTTAIAAILRRKRPEETEAEARPVD